METSKKIALDRKGLIYNHLRQHTALASSSSQEQNLSGSSTPHPQLSLASSKGGFSLGLSFVIPKGIGLPLSHNCMFSISSSSKNTTASLSQIWTARMDQVKKDLSIFKDSDGRHRVKLSVGRLFHELALDLNSDAISVKKYELNQDGCALETSYSYYLQAPDSSSYSPLTVEFTNRNLAAFNWSYLDNYVCQRGLSQSYPLSSMLKFWRSRFVLLPIKSSVTKSLFEQIKEEVNLPESKRSKMRFDVYGGECNESGTKDKSCRKFMEFLEAVNRIRKISFGPRKFPSQQAKNRLSAFNSHTAVPHISKLLLKRQSQPVVTPLRLDEAPSLHSRSGSSFSPSLLLSARFFKRRSLEDTAVATSPRSAHLPVASNVPVSPLEELSEIQLAIGSEKVTTSKQPQHFTFNNADTAMAKPGSTADAKLCLESTPSCRIAQAMIEPDSGFSFITHNGPAVLPRLTFISFYAIQWAKASIQGVKDTATAVDLFQRLIEEGWVCHSSGNPAHKFIHGFFFYTLLLSESLLDHNNEDLPCSPSWSGSSIDVNKPCQFPAKFLSRNPSSCQNDLLAACTTGFQSEFIEVAIPFSAMNEPQPASREVNCATAFEEFGLRNDSYNLECWFASRLHFCCAARDGVLCKHCLCELENESDWPRVEWARYLYNANYHPECAFSFELQWLVATGVVLSET
ncbi:hypothetical protein Ciccas_011569, partial [Cichlidogyrus casuarinus]